MTRLLILSDLHFGLDRTALIEPLLAGVNAAAADLVILSGDLTQRGRSEEYARARAFIDRLEAPWMAVPGNHDVPLFHLLRRLIRPYRNWYGFVTRDMMPVHDTGTVRVIGVNTVDPLAWQRGLIEPATIERVTRALGRDRMNVVVLHHPLEQHPGVNKELMRGAPEALRQLTEAGADVAITGHIHVWQLDHFLDLPRGRPLMQIQTGTALCRREEDRQNEYVVLDIAGDAITISRHIAPMNQPEAAFGPPHVRRYSRADGLWQPVGEGDQTIRW